MWFPMASAPPDWTTLLDELRADHPLTVDPRDDTAGFDDFLDRAAADRTAATFYGLAMRPPPQPLRLVPIVAPIPVFAWWAMWRRRAPGPLVDRLLAALPPQEGFDAAEDPERVWLPAADRTALFG
jgi:hypothetical protein